jgi:hypothetical protein
VSIQVAFGDDFEAAAFRTRFLPCRGYKLAN